NLGDLYFEQYKDPLAVDHLKKALLYSEVSEAVDIKDDIYFNLSLAMESAGQTKKALEFYKKYVEQLEGIWNRDRIWGLA
ncbi:tetratricopeptide repeat protein, partial [Escherichia coli]